MDSSRNRHAIQTETLEHETNTGYSFAMFCDNDLEIRLRISEIHTQISLPESISMHIFHGEKYFASDRSFWCGSTSRLLWMVSIPILRSNHRVFLRFFFQGKAQFGIPDRDFPIPHDWDSWDAVHNNHCTTFRKSCYQWTTLVINCQPFYIPHFDYNLIFLKIILLLGLVSTVSNALWCVPS